MYARSSGWSNLLITAASDRPLRLPVPTAAASPGVVIAQGSLRVLAPRALGRQPCLDRSSDPGARWAIQDSTCVLSPTRLRLVLDVVSPFRFPVGKHYRIDEGV